MAFDDGTQTGVTRSLGVSSGEYQAVRPTFEAVPALVATSGESGYATGSAAVPSQPAPNLQPTPNLQYVFDDPNDGEPGRDRMLVHGLWELVLALGIAGVGFALSRSQPGVLRGAELDGLLIVVCLIGLLGMASAVALRAGVPNLAVGAAAAFSGVWLLEHVRGDDWLVPTAVAVGICAAAGLVQGLVVVGLHVPSWAASLGVLLAAGVWMVSHTPPPRPVPGFHFDPTPDAYLWLAVVASASVLACLVGLHSGIRRGFARFRSVADPARRRGRAAAVIAVLATVISMAVAGFSGLLLAYLDAQITTDDGLVLTALGLGAALLGGTSAFGRRGGIFGTIFAACLIALVLSWLDEPAFIGVVGAAAIGVGLAVTRLVERFGRPVLLPPSEEDESWMPRVHSLAASGKPWSPVPTPTGGLWSGDEGWGSSPR
jgi:ribose/xylose/arabinose/galactoside ABC-type transport system permease subunit